MGNAQDVQEKRLYIEKFNTLEYDNFFYFLVINLWLIDYLSLSFIIE